MRRGWTQDRFPRQGGERGRRESGFGRGSGQGVGRTTGPQERGILQLAEVRGFANPEVCTYVGYAFWKGMCATAPYKKGDPPVTLDSGTPLYWGWDKVTAISQLRLGWLGTCILRDQSIRLSRVSQNAHKKRKPIWRTRAIGSCTFSLSETDSTIQIRIGEPASCTHFDLAACLWGRKQELLYRCNGTEGILCYRLGNNQGSPSRAPPPLLAPRGGLPITRAITPAL
ncbi:hypothetical protein E2320_010772, partial [Naja naja]